MNPNRPSASQRSGADLRPETHSDSCPRCGRPVPRRPTGRPPTWCSQTCRRAAYEERRAANSGAVAIKVVDRVHVAEHGLSECASRVMASPAACRKVLQALAVLARDGTLTTEPKWTSTLTAANRLEVALHTSARDRRW